MNLRGRRRVHHVVPQEANKNQQGNPFANLWEFIMRNLMAVIALLVGLATVPSNTATHETSEPHYVLPSEDAKPPTPVVHEDPCFGAAFTEWSEWSNCDPIYNCDSEMNPEKPKKCPKKTRTRQIAWPPNHPPNPNCDAALIENDESQCNCDKCIFRYGDWIRAPKCHGGGHKCHLKFTRYCQLQNEKFNVIDQYQGTGFKTGILISLCSDGLR